jgi:hypothetical protein
MVLGGQSKLIAGRDQRQDVYAGENPTTVLRTGIGVHWKKGEAA